ncbi:MAG: hypothetical protein ACRBCJ_01690 [Hyphomicrobiaceae bacterium]
MLVYYFRFSLKPVAVPDSFGALSEKGQLYSREEWLRYYFSEQREFEHQKQDFAFIPEHNIGMNKPEHLIIGYIARPRVVAERAPPSDGFHPVEHQSWRGALIVIDPTSHKDGQKIALEHRSDIGKPISVLKSLARSMSVGDEPPPFDVQIDPIVEASSFWNFAEQNDFNINWLSFDAAPPNMFGGAGDYKDEMRMLREKNRVNRVKTTMTSDTTIDVLAGNIKEVVDYTEMGAGSIRARTADNKTYNSKNYIKQDSIDAEYDSEDFWSKIGEWLGERF